MKKFITIVLSSVMLFSMAILATGCANEPEEVEIILVAQGIDDTQLAAMVESGEIPANVTSLWLSNNQISDISPLANLTNLEVLGLGGNQISDISLIANMTNLERLSLQYNPISDISLIANMTNLEDLNLGNNRISDWSPVDHVAEVRGRP